MAIRILLLLTLVSLGICDIGFIFPPNATQGVNDTTIANFSTVHFNDNITVQYELPPGGTLAVFQSCYPSIAVLNESDSWTYQTYRRTDAYNNTGTLLWHVGNGNYGNYTGIGVCQMMMWNYTITACGWGPFGLLNWEQTNTNVLIYSQFFNISAPAKGSKPALITNSKSVSSRPTATATAGSVTCPPSGVPASPIYTPIPVVEHFPPLGQNVIPSFPDADLGV